MGISDESLDVYLELCASVGLLTPTMQELEVFMLASKILADQTITRRKMELARSNPELCEQLPLGGGKTYLAHTVTADVVISLMTDDEREQLRQRVCVK